MKSRWEQVQDWLWGAVWTLGPGFGVAVADIIDDVTNYEGPIDWRHAGSRAGVAALTGLGMYLRKQTQEKKALYEFPPDGGLRATFRAAKIEAELRGEPEEQDAK